MSKIKSEREALESLLSAARGMHSLMENLWKAVPWGSTFDLDIGALNTAPDKLKWAIHDAEKALSATASTSDAQRSDPNG